MSSRAVIEGPTATSLFIRRALSNRSFVIGAIILLAVLFLNLLEWLESVLFKGNQRGYVSD